MSELKYIRRRYDKKGVFRYVEEYEPLRLIETPRSNSQGPLFFNNDMQLEMKVAARLQEIEVDFGYKFNIVPDGDFPSRAFIGGIELDAWRQSDEYTLIKVKTGKDKYGAMMGVVFGSLQGFRDQAARISCPDIDLLAAQNTQLLVEIGYSVKKTVASASTYNEKTFAYFRIELIPYDLAANQILNLQEDGTWKETTLVNGTGDESDLFPVEVEITSAGKKTLEIESDPLPFDGKLVVVCYELVSPGEWESVYDRITIEKVSVELIHNDEYAQETEIISEVNSKPYTFKPEPVKLYHGDIPEYSNNKIMYKQTWYLQDGRPTKRWYRNTLEGLTIQEHLLKEMMNINRVPRQAVSGTFVMLSGFLDMGYIMKDLSNYGKLFLINALEWNDARCTYSFELLEVHPGDGIDFEFATALEYEPLDYNSSEYN